MVVPVQQDSQLLLVKQYRYTGKRDSIEFPCGGLKDGATHDETARNELLEETGFLAGQLTPVGAFNPCNGLVDELCKVYIARCLTYSGARPDETESMELVRFSIEELEARILDGTIWDGMTIVSWALAKPVLIDSRI